MGGGGKTKLQFILGNCIPRNMIPSLFSQEGPLFLATFRRNCFKAGFNVIAKITVIVTIT